MEYMKSWIWTSRPTQVWCPGMEGAEELIMLLCTQIGMIMEDASPIALTIGSMAPTARREAVVRLYADIRILERLIAAVTAIAD